MAKEIKTKIEKVTPPSNVHYIPFYFDQDNRSTTGPAFAKKEDAEKFIKERTADHANAHILVADLDE